MSSALDVIDFYAIQPKFFIKKAESIPSKTGVILSIITILISIAIAVFYIKEWLSGTNLTVTYTQEFKKMYSLDLREKPFFFTGFSGNNHLDSNVHKIIEVKAYHSSEDPINSADYKRNITKLEIEKCSENKMFSSIPSKIIGGIPNMNYFCLNLEQKNFNISGEIFNYLQNSHISIQFSRCVNTTKNNNDCFPNEVIDQYLLQGFFLYGSLDYDINHNSDQNPFEPTLFVEIYKISKKIQEVISMKIKQVVYQSDNGVFFKSFENYTYALHDKTEISTIDMIDLFPNLLMMFSIETSGLREIHTRKYPKLQEVFTQINVMLNSIKAACVLAMGFLGDKKYFEYLINCLLSSKESEIIENTRKFIVIKEKLFQEDKRPGKVKNKIEDNLHANSNQFISDRRSSINKISNETKLSDHNAFNGKEKKDFNIDLNELSSSNQYTSLDKKARIILQPSLVKTENLINDKNTLNINNESYIADNTKLNFSIDSKSKLTKENLALKNPIEKERKTNFNITFREYIYSLFTAKRSPLMQKFDDFANVIKEILSIELILREINDVMDIKKSLVLDIAQEKQ